MNRYLTRAEVSELAGALLLTEPEIAELTDCARRSDQMTWLRSKNWQFELGARGRIKIGRAYAERKLSGEARVAPAESQSYEINRGALEKANRSRTREVATDC